MSRRPKISRDELERLYQLKRDEQIERARKDPAAFVEYALADERTRMPLRNAPHHRVWHDFFSEVDWGVIMAPIEHGKTVQFGVGRLLWELGNDPSLRCAFIGESEAAAKKVLASIKANIERNPRVREVFPNLRPSTRKEAAWSDTDITIARQTIARDPSVQARGIGSRSVLGSRLDRIMLDDALNYESTRTKAQRDKIRDWFDTTLLTRVVDDYHTGERGKIYVIGTPWDRDDLLHNLMGRPGWASLRLGAVDNPNDDPRRWRPLWPERWPLERLLARREGMTDYAFMRKFLCEVTIDANARFRSEWIDAMFAAGKGRVLMASPPREPSGAPMPCFTGVDLGIGQGEGHDLTVLFTVAGDRKGRRIVVDVESGRWTGPDIVRKIEQKHHAYNSIVLVESVAAQRFIAEFAGERGVPVQPFTTTAQNKWNEAFGVESIAVEMRQGLWVAPSGESGTERDPELVAWAAEMTHYSPETHTGDRLMASWFAREGLRAWLADSVQISDHMVR